jgi:hypothetical protein
VQKNPETSLYDLCSMETNANPLVFSQVLISLLIPNFLLTLEKDLKTCYILPLPYFSFITSNTMHKEHSYEVETLFHIPSSTAM